MMILVKISGYEPYYIQEFSKKWHEDLVRIFKCDEKELSLMLSFQLPKNKRSI